jgi:hypothetical protein
MHTGGSDPKTEITVNVPRLVFSAPRVAAPAITPAGADRSVAMVDLFAYAQDCILSGRIALTAARLTDVLNDHDEYTLVDVLVESLVDGHVIERREVLVSRDELLLVQIVGPRGNVQRRHRTRQHPLLLHVGPFKVQGYVHTLPGSDAIASLRHRRPMVPFTEASIELLVDGIVQHRHLSAVLVNRDQIDSVVEASDEGIEMPDVPFGDRKGPLVKDFTGAVHGERNSAAAEDQGGRPTHG